MLYNIVIASCSLLFSLSLFAQEAKHIVIKAACLEELPAILALDREISYEYFKPIFLQYPNYSIGKDPDNILEEELAYDQETFTKAVTMNCNEQLFVATDKDSIVGFAFFHINDNSIIIDLLCVDKAYRGKGIGKLFVAAIFQIPNISSYRLAVIDKNILACLFWESLGFQLLAEKPVDVGNDFPADCSDIYRYYEYHS